MPNRAALVCVAASPSMLIAPWTDVLVVCTEHFVALFEQAVAKMGTDEAGAAGDEDALAGS